MPKTKDRLKELRSGTGLTQVQMAKVLGLKGRTYQDFELKDTLPTTKHLIALADYYNVSVDYLLCRTEKKEVNR